jgi:hypothetical protein
MAALLRRISLLLVPLLAGHRPKTNLRTPQRSGRMSHKQGAKRFLRFAEYGLAFDLASERLLQE